MENIDFREKQVFAGLRSSPSFSIPKNSQNPPPGTPPGRPIFYFFGRWIFTRYNEIVTFSIWGPSGRPADRARAGAFSGTLSRPFFVKPWGDFDGNPQLILTIPFWSLFEHRPFLGKKRVSGGSLLVVLGRWNCTRSNEIVTFSFLERLKIERSSLALPKKRKSENSNISKDREQKLKSLGVAISVGNRVPATRVGSCRRGRGEVNLPDNRDL